LEILQAFFLKETSESHWGRQSLVVDEARMEAEVFGIRSLEVRAALGVVFEGGILVSMTDDFLVDLAAAS